MSWTVSRWRDVAGLGHAFGGRGDPSPAGVTTLRQVHGRLVHASDEVTSGLTEGDGLAAARAGLVGVWTADCVPLLLLAREARVAAAVHCGWRGSAAGMVPAALEVLDRRWGVSPGDIEAALGPAIGGCCYEVGEEVRSAFLARVGTVLGSTGFEPREAGLHLDLRAFLTAELRDLGVGRIEAVGPCTACSTDLLYSYRKEGKTDRQLAWIGWPRGQ